jgi:hypothetical protein
MKPVMFAAGPNFVKQIHARHVDAAVQVIRDATILAPRGTNESS